jgi:hypothetical protein
MGQTTPESPWKINWIKPRLQWIKSAIRPAEISAGLCRVMLARQNVLEDANYHKVLPNHFVVELDPEIYQRHFEPMVSSLVKQWRERLVQNVKTTNNRLGRKEYRLLGQVQIDLRPVPGMKNSQARVLSRIAPDFDTMDQPVRQSGQLEDAPAYLEMLNADRRWALRAGDNTIGRSERCHVHLDLPLIKEKRLISSQHATLRIENGQCYLFDGDPNQKPSANGTFVNAQRVSQYGILLHDGDTIILASVDPLHPRPDTPGVAALRYRKRI